MGQAYTRSPRASFGPDAEDPSACRGRSRVRHFTRAGSFSRPRACLGAIPSRRSSQPSAPSTATATAPPTRATLGCLRLLCEATALSRRERFLLARAPTSRLLPLLGVAEVAGRRHPVRVGPTPPGPAGEMSLTGYCAGTVNRRLDMWVSGRCGCAVVASGRPLAGLAREPPAASV